MQQANCDRVLLMAGLVSRDDVLEQLRIDRATLRRYEAKQARGFPRGVKIGATTYYSETLLRRWIADQAGVPLP